MSDTEKRQLPVWQESVLLVVTAMVMAVVLRALLEGPWTGVPRIVT